MEEDGEEATVYIDIHEVIRIDPAPLQPRKRTAQRNYIDLNDWATSPIK